MSYWDYVEYKEMSYSPKYGNMVDITPMTLELDIPEDVFICASMFRDKIHSLIPGQDMDYRLLSLLKAVFNNLNIVNLPHTKQFNIKVAKENNQIFILGEE